LATVDCENDGEVDMKTILLLLIVALTGMLVTVLLMPEAAPEPVPQVPNIFHFDDSGNLICPPGFYIETKPNYIITPNGMNAIDCNSELIKE